jgi:hypothetical protein
MISGQPCRTRQLHHARGHNPDPKTTRDVDLAKTVLPDEFVEQAHVSSWRYGRQRIRSSSAASVINCFTPEMPLADKSGPLPLML